MHANYFWILFDAKGNYNIESLEHVLPGNIYLHSTESLDPQIQTLEI